MLAQTLSWKKLLLIPGLTFSYLYLNTHYGQVEASFWALRRSRLIMKRAMRAHLSLAVLMPILQSTLIDLSPAATVSKKTQITSQCPMLADGTHYGHYTSHQHLFLFHTSMQTVLKHVWMTKHQFLFVSIHTIDIMICTFRNQVF